MKNNYLYLFLLLLLSNFCRGQDCTVQKVVSDPTICIGNNAIITLFESENGVSYQLRQGTTDIGAPQIGNGGNLDFVVSPSSTTTYNILAYHTLTSCSTILTDESTVTVNQLPNIALSSVAATANQTVCLNNAITDIQYAVTNATGPLFQDCLRA